MVQIPIMNGPAGSRSPTMASVNAKRRPSSHASTVEAETAVLSNFFADLDDYHSQVFVGHYINGFDLRFILCRAVVLGVKIPRCIPRDPKPWGNACFDTMTAWAGQRGTISMDNLSRALGIEGKGDFDGSMVAEAWANGEHAKIEEYCRHDVQVVRDIHRKFMAAGWFDGSLLRQGASLLLLSALLRAFTSDRARLAQLTDL